jgi:hypothetical protein
MDHDPSKEPSFFSKWEYRLIRWFLLILLALTLLKLLIDEIISLCKRWL